MKDHFVFDLNRIMEEVFEAARNFKDAFTDEFAYGPGGFKFHWDENVDYYPAYSYPPANIFLTKERELIFEFALSGFHRDKINLEFKGDYMLLSVKVPEGTDHPEGSCYFKRRLKLKEIVEQKYYVPASKFNRDKCKATFTNGLLTVKIPPKDNYNQEKKVKVEIVNEPS